jgi:hypothetical protein
MASTAVVEDRIDDGLRLIEQFKADGGSILVAFWAKAAEESSWYLYIATESVQREGPAVAYRAIHDSFRKLVECRLDLFEIKMVGPSDSITRDVLALLARRPGRLPAWFGSLTLGGVEVEEVYIYPRKTEEVVIYGSFFRGYPGGSPLTFSFDPFPTGGPLVEDNHAGQRRSYPEDTSLSWIVSAPEGSVVERVDRGLPVLAWNLHGRRTRSSANEIWTLANLGLHGFRFLRVPGQGEETSRRDLTDPHE